jgi:hypothetical protein
MHAPDPYQVIQSSLSCLYPTFLVLFLLQFTHSDLENLLPSFKLQYIISLFASGYHP